MSELGTATALTVYLKANAAEKVVECYIQRGEYDLATAYSAKLGLKCDYTKMQELMRTNPQVRTKTPHDTMVLSCMSWRCLVLESNVPHPRSRNDPKSIA